MLKFKEINNPVIIARMSSIKVMTKRSYFISGGFFNKPILVVSLSL